MASTLKGPSSQGRRRSLFAHEALAGGRDERARLGEEHAHCVAEGDGLFVDPARRLQLLERSRRELDGGVERQRRELLALRLLHRLGLLLGELAQTLQEILRITAEKREAAFAHRGERYLPAPSKRRR